MMMSLVFSFFFTIATMPFNTVSLLSSSRGSFLLLAACSRYAAGQTFASRWELGAGRVEWLWNLQDRAHGIYEAIIGAADDTS